MVSSPNNQLVFYAALSDEVKSIVSVTLVGGILWSASCCFETVKNKCTWTASVCLC